MDPSPITYDPLTRSFHCAGCLETIELRRKDSKNPETLLSFKEQLAFDRAECGSAPRAMTAAAGISRSVSISCTHPQPGVTR